MPSVADLLKKQIASKTAQAKKKADAPIITPDQILTDLIKNFEIKEAQEATKQNTSNTGTSTGTKSGTQAAAPTKPNAVQVPVQNPVHNNDHDAVSLKVEKGVLSDMTRIAVHNPVQPQGIVIKDNYEDDSFNLRANTNKYTPATSNINTKTNESTPVERGTKSGTLSGTTIHTEKQDNAVRIPVQNPVQRAYDDINIAKNEAVPVHNPAFSPVQNPVLINSLSVLKNKLVSLTGLRKNIFKFFVIKTHETRNGTTGMVSYNTIGKSTNSSYESVRGTIRRLRAEGLLIKISNNTGRHGYVDFEIPNFVLDLFHQIELQGKHTFALESQDEYGTKSGTLSGYMPSSSISSNINTTTKENKEEQQAVPDDWKVFNSETFLGIDIEPLASIGFTETHLKQLYRANVTTVEDVQASIYMFAFDLEHNKKADSLKGPALNFFMGIMRRLGAYTKPENYKSPREIAQENLRNDKRAEADRIRLMEVQNFEDEFTIWWAGLSKDAQESISSSEHTKQRRMYDAKKYYRAEVLKESNESH